MKKKIALLTVIAVWLGCASTTPPGVAVQRVSAQRALKEEFNPIRKDLLLIQPQFPPPATERETAVVKIPPASPVLQPLESAYRVQVMALSNEQTARARGAELQKSLGVPVQVESERHLFVVRAGVFAQEREAAALRDRIARRGPSYADAFVLPPAQPVAAESTAIEIAEQLPIVEESVEEIVGEVPAPIAVTAFGWRISLDLFDQHAEAVKLQRNARRRLARDDIYVTFQEPYYKVEVGNYLEENDARVAAETIERRGYENALAVRGKITVLQERQ
jgi:hypothetical protein